MITVTKPDLPALNEYVRYLHRIWSTKCLTNDGEFVQRLAKKLEQYLGTKNIVLVNNGTLAIHLALKALCVKGEVVTTPYTFPATTNVLIWEGLVPVFADIDPETFNIDPSQVERSITSKTSAILAVHVYGNPCDVRALQEIADRRNVKLVYDAAHAFGVELSNHSVLEHGDVSTLSFHATKVFHTIEGGAVVSKKERVHKLLKLLRNHGIRSEEQVVLAGTNAKMNEFQAVMGLCNLERLNQRIKRRRMICELYKKTLDGHVGFQTVAASKYNYAYMPILLRDQRQRDELYSEMIAKGIRPRKYFYPLASDSDYLRSQRCAAVAKKKLKIAYDISSRVLCLPLYSELDFETIDRISELVIRKTKPT